MAQVFIPCFVVIRAEVAIYLIAGILMMEAALPPDVTIPGSHVQGKA